MLYYYLRIKEHYLSLSLSLTLCPQCFPNIPMNLLSFDCCIQEILARVPHVPLVGSKTTNELCVSVWVDGCEKACEDL